MRSVLIKLFHVFLSLGLMITLGGVQSVHAAGIVVNSTADNTTVNGQCTLREAITNANNDAAIHSDCTSGSGDDVITFNLSGCPCTITLTLGELLISSNMTITGTGASNLIISGGNASLVMYAGSTTVNLSQLTITGGSNPTGGPDGGSGGAISIGSSAVLNVSQSVISGNSAGFGAGIYSNGGAVTLLNSTVSNNTASGDGGGVYANGQTSTTTITNSTISGNSATGVGIAIVNGGTMTVRNTTIANNTAGGGSSGVFNSALGTISLRNTIVASSSCTGTITNAGNNIDSGSTCGFGSANNSLSDTNPLLGTLTGSPAYFPLNTGSPAIDAGDNAVCAAAPVNNTSQNGVTRPVGAQCDIGSVEYEPAVDITVRIGGVEQGSYALDPGESTRESYNGINDGPAKVENLSSVSLIAAERVIYKVNGINTSFSEMMALPNSQLNTTYWLPWYNNVDLDTQLRFGNVSGAPASVHVYIGGVEMTGSPFALTATGAGQSTRVSFAGINNGPVQIVSDQLIVASERVIYNVAGAGTSFSEMMALPNDQVDTTYWLPWYNNVDLDTQLRIGNVSGVPASVQVYIGGTEMTGSPFALTATGAGQSIRVSFPGVNAGPVQIVSDQNIVAAERVIYTVAGSATSFTEMMALPAGKVNTTYWMPWYNNVDLDTQLRFGNVSGAPASVHVYIGGVEMTGSPFALTATGAGQSTRISFAGINDGPVQIVSDQNIVAAERVIYTVNGSATSFSEMMGLPDALLDTSYWTPWYNNVDLDTQLRFGVPSN
jgi:CSLREA domain-containing protein